MKMYKFITHLFVLMFFSASLFAAEDSNSIEESDIQEQNNMSDPKTINSASDSIDDWADDALVNFGRDVGEFGEKNGKFILFASEPVSLKSTDPQYGDAMINAFGRALTKMQKEYVRVRFGQIVGDKLIEFSDDTYAKEIELPQSSDPQYTDKLVSLFEKSLDVADKKLDKELIALGEDPTKFQSMPLKDKKIFFRDKFLVNTLVESSGSISGLFALQTAVIKDKNGEAFVGIIGIASDKTIQIAKDIKLQRASLVNGKGREISTLLPASKGEYLHTFGTRLAYDVDGTPAIISYGISSYRSDSGNFYINSKLKSASKSDAIDNADAQIAEIINGYMSFSDKSKSGGEITEIVEKELKANPTSIEKTIVNIIKINKEEIKSTASAKLQGISTVKSWSYTAPEGQKYTGAVRVWKYSTLNSIKGFNESDYSKPKQESQFKSSEKSSTPVNSMDDF